MNEVFQKYKESDAFFTAFCIPLGLAAYDDKEEKSEIEDSK